MCGPMKEAVKRRKFSSAEEVIGSVQNWLKTQKKKIFGEIKKHVTRWNRCVEVQGDYVEK
jgi:hypothetical protein